MRIDITSSTYCFSLLLLELECLQKAQTEHMNDLIDVEEGGGGEDMFLVVFISYQTLNTERIDNAL